jgi:enoyl-CoA hydratase/carnithine racemase
MNTELTLDITDGIALITLNRPEFGNSLSGALIEGPW